MKCCFCSSHLHVCHHWFKANSLNSWSIPRFSSHYHKMWLFWMWTLQSGSSRPELKSCLLHSAVIFQINPNLLFLEMKPWLISGRHNNISHLLKCPHTVSGQWCSVSYMLVLHVTVEYTVSEVVQAGDGNIHFAAEKLFLWRWLRGRQEISYFPCTFIKIKIVWWVSQVTLAHLLKPQLHVACT